MHDENKISLDMAEQEFARFGEAMDLDFEVSGKEEIKTFKQSKTRILKALMNGSLIIDDKGQPVYKPQRSDSDTITFYEPTGASLMSMDKGGEEEKIKKLYLMLADMTKKDTKVFAKMKIADLNVCMAINTLFLG